MNERLNENTHKEKSEDFLEQLQQPELEAQLVLWGKTLTDATVEQHDGDFEKGNELFKEAAKMLSAEVLIYSLCREVAAAEYATPIHEARTTGMYLWKPHFAEVLFTNFDKMYAMVEGARSIFKSLPKFEKENANALDKNDDRMATQDYFTKYLVSRYEERIAIPNKDMVKKESVPMFTNLVYLRHVFKPNAISSKERVRLHTKINQIMTKLDAEFDVQFGIMYPKDGK